MITIRTRQNTQKTFSDKNYYFSREYYRLVYRIGELRSKTEELAIFSSELETLKSYLSKPISNMRHKMEYALRLFYCHNFGYNISFGKIFCLNLTKEKCTLAKKIGYLAVSRILAQNDEKRLLVVGSIQSDLVAPNFLEIENALLAVGRLVNPSYISAVIRDVKSLATGSARIPSSVEAKALFALYHCRQTDPHSCEAFSELLLQKLAQLNEKTNIAPDQPQLAALSILHHEAVQKNFEEFPPDRVVPALVAFFFRVIDRSFDEAFEHVLNPVPWHQDLALRVLRQYVEHGALAGQEEKAEALLEAIVKFNDDGLPVGEALVIETFLVALSLKTVSNKMLVSVGTFTMQFLASENSFVRTAAFRLLRKLSESAPEAVGEEVRGMVSRLLFDEDAAVRLEAFRLCQFVFSEETVDTLSSSMLAAIYKLSVVKKTNTEEQTEPELLATTAEAVVLANEYLLFCEKAAPTQEWFVEQSLEALAAFVDSLDFSVLGWYVECVFALATDSPVLFPLVLRRIEALLEPDFERKVTASLVYVYALFAAAVPAEASVKTLGDMRAFVTAFYSEADENKWVLWTAVSNAETSAAENAPLMPFDFSADLDFVKTDWLDAAAGLVEEIYTPDYEFVKGTSHRRSVSRNIDESFDLRFDAYELVEPVYKTEKPAERFEDGQPVVDNVFEEPGVGSMEEVAKKAVSRFEEKKSQVSVWRRRIENKSARTKDSSPQQQDRSALLKQKLARRAGGILDLVAAENSKNVSVRVGNSEARFGFSVVAENGERFLAVKLFAAEPLVGFELSEETNSDFALQEEKSETDRVTSLFASIGVEDTLVGEDTGSEHVALSFVGKAGVFALASKLRVVPKTDNADKLVVVLTNQQWNVLETLEVPVSK